MEIDNESICHFVDARVSIRTFADSGKTSGFVRVEISPELESQIHDMNGHMFAGSPVYVDIARRRFVYDFTCNTT